MPTTLKHRQHHVCQAYLRGWAMNDKLWVLQDDKVRRASTRDVAVQRHFYKLQALSDLEIAFIRKWIEKLPESSRKANEGWLTMFGLFPTLRARMTESEVAANPELVAFYDEQIINLEEEFHSGMESRVAPQIKSLRDGDVSFFADENLVTGFCHFLALQHFRTSGMKTRVVARSILPPKISMEKCWNILSHVMASSVGLTFYVERKRNPLVLLENKTSMPFVTSDQPTVNLLGGSDDTPPPEHLALYYPVSPRYAALLDALEAPCGFAGRALSVDDVRNLNAHVVRSSNRQIFGHAPEILKEICANARKVA